MGPDTQIEGGPDNNDDDDDDDDDDKAINKSNVSCSKSGAKR